MQFSDLGSHCSLAFCNTQARADFLPFQCNACKNVFCLEHRSYDGHSCKEFAKSDHRVVTCPICKASIHYQGDDDAAANHAFAAHERQGCNPQLKEKKSRCRYGPCKTVLVLSNKTKCLGCRLEYCLTHRHAEDHSCKSIEKRGNPSKLAQSITSVFTKPPAPQPIPESKKKHTPIDPRQQLKETAHRRQRAGSDAATKHRCGHCPMIFSSVSELRGHVQQQHARNKKTNDGCVIC